MIKVLYKIFFAIILMMITASTFAQTAAPIAEIQSILEKPKIMCGRFDQTKLLVGINKPLLSNGRFCVVADKGILWRTLYPFPNTLRLTQDEIIQTQGKQTTMRMDATQEPVVRMTNTVLFSLLAGDFSQLDKIFILNSHIENSHWHVNLKAREPGLAKVIGNISLEGDQHVKKVNIQESNGDKTMIIFSDIKNGGNAMTKEEGALFDQEQPLS